MLTKSVQRNGNPKIILVYTDSGGGHRAAATALCEVVRQQQRSWHMEMASVQDILNPMDFVRKYTGVPFEDVYNILLRRGWTLGSAQMIKLMHALIRATHDDQVKLVEQWLDQSVPDLVVSMIPHYNRALKQALDRSLPNTPLVTILTDIADYPPNFWMERQDQYFICGSDHSAKQARDLGLADDQVLRTSGMILDPRFYEPMMLDRASERVRLGLKPDLPTGLVLFGGQGSREIVRIAKALNRTDSGVQLILLCGRNAEVADEVRGLAPEIPMVVEGFTKEIPHYMELADFFIGKPGPGSISEALAKRLPVIVQRNAWTLAHERFNAAWVEEQGVGLVVSNFSSEIFLTVKTLLEPKRYAAFRERAGAMRNFAAYEIPELLQGILSESLPIPMPPERFNTYVSAT